MHKPGAALYKEMYDNLNSHTYLSCLNLSIFSRESQPVDWADFSQANIRFAEHDREASIRLRGHVSFRGHEYP